MKSLRKWLLYFAYISVVTILCLYFLFPSDAIKAYICDAVNNASGNVTITIDRVNPSFPPGLTIHQVKIFQAKQPLLGVDLLKIVPDYPSFLNQETSFNFDGKSHEGSLHGKAYVTRKKETPGLRIDAQFEGLQISRIPAIADFTLQMISGRLDGKVAYIRNENAEETADAELVLLDCGIKLPEDQFKLGSLNFSKIEAKVRLSKDQLHLNQCSIKGPQVDGSVAGVIRIADQYEKSTLDLRGTIKPHHLFLSGLGKSITKFLFPRQKITDKGLPFQIKGTLGKPHFMFN